MRTTLVLLAGVVSCLGAVAYAAAPHGPLSAPPNPERSTGAAAPPKPSIGKHPDKVAVSNSAKFEFSAHGRNLRFQCRLDGRGWKGCRPPVLFTGLVAGSHSFSVRVLAASGRHGRPAGFRWRVLEPKDFSIVPQRAGLGALYPGAPPQALPVTIANPNPVPIFVISLRATASTDPQGCASAENLLFAEASVSNAQPLKVPAGGSVSLPAPGVSSPAIQLRDLPINQDACQHASFPLAFSGQARG